VNAFEAGKLAALRESRDRRDSEAGGAVGAAAAGTGLVYGSKNLVTGKKRLYHGTSDQAWRQIRERGLLAEMGGAGHGSGATVKSEGFANNSRGKVHVTRFKPIASAFARLTGEGRGGGRVLKLDVDYDKFRKMEVDPDMAGGKSGRLHRNIASRGTFNISPDEIQGAKRSGAMRRSLETAKKIPGYAIKYPGRFGAGALGTAAGVALLHRAAGRAKAIYDRRSDK